MGVLRRRFCADMIGGKVIYLFLDGLGYDACAGVSSLQCCWLAVGVRNILLLSLAARCWETMLVCMSSMFAFMSAVVTVQGSEGMFVVYRELLNVVGLFSRCEVLCVVYLCSGCEGYCAFVWLAMHVIVNVSVWEGCWFSHADVYVRVMCASRASS